MKKYKIKLSNKVKGISSLLLACLGVGGVLMATQDALFCLAATIYTYICFTIWFACHAYSNLIKAGREVKE